MWCHSSWISRKISSKNKGLRKLVKSNKSPFARVLASLIFCVALLPGAAQAASVQYDVTTGVVNISVLVAGTVIGTASSGVSGSLTIDHAAQSLAGLDLQLSPNILIALSQSTSRTRQSRQILPLAPRWCLQQPRASRSSVRPL